MTWGIILLTSAHTPGCPPGQRWWVLLFTKGTECAEKEGYVRQEVLLSVGTEDRNPRVCVCVYTRVNTVCILFTVTCLCAQCNALPWL